MLGVGELGLGGKHILPQSFVGRWWEAIRDAELQESEIWIVEFESLSGAEVNWDDFELENWKLLSQPPRYESTWPTTRKKNATGPCASSCVFNPPRFSSSPQALQASLSMYRRSLDTFGYLWFHLLYVAYFDFFLKFFQAVRSCILLFLVFFASASVLPFSDVFYDYKLE